MFAYLPSAKNWINLDFVRLVEQHKTSEHVRIHEMNGCNFTLDESDSREFKAIMQQIATKPFREPSLIPADGDKLAAIEVTTHGISAYELVADGQHKGKYARMLVGPGVITSPMLMAKLLVDNGWGCCGDGHWGIRVDFPRNTSGIMMNPETGKLEPVSFVGLEIIGYPKHWSNDAP